MIKKVVLFSGITNKQAEEYKQINDFKTYLLKEDLNSLCKSYSAEQQDNYFKYLPLFAEIDDHLFYICRVEHAELLKEYTKEKIMNHLINDFEKRLNNNKTASFGMAQFLKRIDEYNKNEDRIKQIKKQEIEERKRAEEEKKRKEQEEYEKKLDIAEKQFADGEKIDAEVFCGLIKRYNIDIPLKTLGWIKNKLVSISKDTYSAYSHSKVIFNYTKELTEAINNKINITNNV